jgi:uncharacterized protein YcgL (UPF0745 family)
MNVLIPAENFKRIWRNTLLERSNIANDAGVSIDTKWPIDNNRLQCCLNTILSEKHSNETNVSKTIGNTCMVYRSTDELKIVLFVDKQDGYPYINTYRISQMKPIDNRLPLGIEIKNLPSLAVHKNKDSITDIFTQDAVFIEVESTRHDNTVQQSPDEEFELIGHGTYMLAGEMLTMKLKMYDCDF